MARARGNRIHRTDVYGRRRSGRFCRVFRMEGRGVRTLLVRNTQLEVSSEERALNVIGGYSARSKFVREQKPSIPHSEQLLTKLIKMKKICVRIANVSLNFTR